MEWFWGGVLRACWHVETLVEMLYEVLSNGSRNTCVYNQLIINSNSRSLNSWSPSNMQLVKTMQFHLAKIPEPKLERSKKNPF